MSDNNHQCPAYCNPYDVKAGRCECSNELARDVQDNLNEDFKPKKPPFWRRVVGFILPVVLQNYSGKNAKVINEIGRRLDRE